MSPGQALRKPAFIKLQDVIAVFFVLFNTDLKALSMSFIGLGVSKAFFKGRI